MSETNLTEKALLVFKMVCLAILLAFEILIGSVVLKAAQQHAGEIIEAERMVAEAKYGKTPG